MFYVKNKRPTTIVHPLNKHSIFPFIPLVNMGKKTKKRKNLMAKLFVCLFTSFVCLFDHWYWTFNDNVDGFWIENFWKFFEKFTKKNKKQNGIPLYSHTNIVWVDLVCLFFLAVSNIFERSIISWLNGTPPPPKKSLSSSLSMIMMASYASLIGGLFFRCFR